MSNSRVLCLELNTVDAILHMYNAALRRDIRGQVDNGGRVGACCIDASDILTSAEVVPFSSGHTVACVLIYIPMLRSMQM